MCLSRILTPNAELCSVLTANPAAPIFKNTAFAPFEEKSDFLGKDLGYDVPINEEEGPQGMLIYFQDEYRQISKGHWAIIDVGEEDGIHFGQQLVIYRKVKGKKETIENIGNLIVIDTQAKTSTVKILSSKSPLRLGDRVQPHF